MSIGTSRVDAATRGVLFTAAAVALVTISSMLGPRPGVEHLVGITDGNTLDEFRADASAMHSIEAAACCVSVIAKWASRTSVDDVGAAIVEEGVAVAAMVITGASRNWEGLDSTTAGVLTIVVGDIGAATLVEVVDIIFGTTVGNDATGKLHTGIHLMERLQQPS
jgi:hypothetical protein